MFIRNLELFQMKTEITGTVISFTKDSFEGKEGNTIDFAYCLLRVEGNMYRFSVIKDLDLMPFLDEEVDLEIEFSPSTSRASRVKIVGKV